LFKTLFKPQAELEETFAAYYLLECIEAYQQNRLETAKQWAEKGLNLYPNNPIILNALGIVFLQWGDFLKARTIFGFSRTCRECP